MRIVVIEDSPDISDTIRISLSLRWPDAEIFSSGTAEHGLEIVETKTPDVVILDLGLPDQDGISVLRKIRQFTDIPVIIVTGRGEEMDRVRGLETGADDYIVKPFSHTELMARVRAVLRRAHMPELRGDAGVIRGSGFSIDLAAHRVTVHGNEVSLTPTEWRLLTYLTRNEGRVMTHRNLADKVWDNEYVEDSTIKMAVRRLRLKLQDDPKAPKIIRSHRGLGYSFTKEQ